MCYPMLSSWTAAECSACWGGTSCSTTLLGTAGSAWVLLIVPSLCFDFVNILKTKCQFCPISQQAMVSPSLLFVPFTSSLRDGGTEIQQQISLGVWPLFLRHGLKEPRSYRCEPRFFFLQLPWIRKTDHRIHTPRALFFWNLPLLNVLEAEVTTEKKIRSRFWALEYRWWSVGA